MIRPISFLHLRSIFSVVCIVTACAALLFVNTTASAQRPASGSGHQAAPDTYVLIHAGTLLAVPGKKPSNNVTLVVKNDRVDRVEKGYLSADAIGADDDATVQVIDLSDKFILPGLMDAHVHLRHQPSRRRGERARRGVWQVPNSAEEAVNAVDLRAPQPRGRIHDGPGCRFR